MNGIAANQKRPRVRGLFIMVFQQVEKLLMLPFEYAGRIDLFHLVVMAVGAALYFPGVFSLGVEEVRKVQVERIRA